MISIREKVLQTCDDELCPGNEKVYTYLENVISEVASVFTSPYIQIGGE